MAGKARMRFIARSNRLRFERDSGHYAGQVIYGVDCIYESCSIRLARWVSAKTDVVLKDFLNTEKNQLYYDNADRLCYLAPNPVNLELTIERWPDCVFSDTYNQCILKIHLMISRGV